MSKTCDLIPRPEEIDKTLDVLKRIYDVLKPYDILNREIEIKVPELIGEYSIALAVTRKLTAKRFSLQFPASSGIFDITVHSLDFFIPIRDFFVFTGDSWRSDVSRLPRGVDKLLMKIRFRLPDASFLDNLVRRDTPREVPGEEKHEYWMHAQIRHPEALKGIYGRLDLCDVPFGVNVGVHQEIRNVIPREFVDSLRAQKELGHTTDTEKRLKLALEIARTRTRYTGKEHSYFSELQDLFLPGGFKKFISVTPPFEYSTCNRGPDFYGITFPTFPQSMEVVSRTNLNLEKLAAQGILTYSKKQLLGDVRKIFAR
jgi:hypothetical protein